MAGDRSAENRRLGHSQQRFCIFALPSGWLKAARRSRLARRESRPPISQRLASRSAVRAHLRGKSSRRAFSRLQDQPSGCAHERKYLHAHRRNRSEILTCPVPTEKSSWEHTSLSAISIGDGHLDMWSRLVESNHFGPDEPPPIQMQDDQPVQQLDQ